MKKVFADAGYWVAVLNPHDDLHSKALQVSDSLGPHLIVTSEMVLSEVAAYFSDKGSRLRQAVVDLIRFICDNPNSRVIPQTSLQFRDALTLYAQSTDKEWSLTDCGSFLIMRELQIGDSLAYDKHFEPSQLRCVAPQLGGRIAQGADATGQ